MSDQPLQRRRLVAVDSPPPSVDPAAIAAVAAKHSFEPPPVPVAAPSAAGSTGARRQRQPTGRDHQFNVRLRRDTLDFIYALANERNIPVAQVIEEATEALKRQR